MRCSPIAALIVALAATVHPVAPQSATLGVRSQPGNDMAQYARYSGAYVIAPGRTLTLSWEDDALFATFPNGARTQVFLASPTDEVVRTVGAGRLRFTLGPDGRPIAAALVRGDQEVWRGVRREPTQ